MPLRGLRVGLADVVGASMRPTLRPGDTVLVLYAVPVRPGDVVILRRPDRRDLIVLKRIERRVDGDWWVRGDNPAESTDSRAFGPVPDADVLGRAVLRVWPPRLLTRVRQRAA